MWIILSLTASIFWGMAYAFNEQVYKEISIFSALAITSVVLFAVALIAAVWMGTLRKDLVSLGNSRTGLFMLLAASGTTVAAEILIASAIHDKSATLASLIEISYPVFVTLFAILLFGESEINSMTVAGGILILAGVFLVSYFNR